MHPGPLLVLLGPPTAPRHELEACWWVCMDGNMGTHVCLWGRSGCSVSH